MGYRIVYNPDMNYKFPPKQGNLKKKMILCLTIGITLFLIFAKTDLNEILIPGDAKDTLFFAETMIAEIQEGKPIAEAFDSFCESILISE